MELHVFLSRQVDKEVRNDQVKHWAFRFYPHNQITNTSRDNARNLTTERCNLLLIWICCFCEEWDGFNGMFSYWLENVQILDTNIFSSVPCVIYSNHSAPRIIKYVESKQNAKIFDRIIWVIRITWFWCDYVNVAVTQHFTTFSE